jgi:hypothetical protein
METLFLPLQAHGLGWMDPMLFNDALLTEAAIKCIVMWENGRVLWIEGSGESSAVAYLIKLFYHLPRGTE